MTSDVSMCRIYTIYGRCNSIEVIAVIRYYVKF